jgi:hypothetical protein
MTGNLTRRFVTGAMIAAGLWAGAAMAQDASGNYRVEGRNPDGTPYHGTAKAVQTGDMVQVLWSGGKQAYSGQGPREGRVVTIDWGAGAPVIYVVMENGDMHGTWDNGRALDLLIRR